MQVLFNLINKPLGWILESIAGLMGGNFAAAVFFFTLIINIILLPLSIKSQKSSVQQTRIKPKLDELKKRYGDDKKKYSEEMQKLYQQENVSMSGGCLPMILRLVLMLSIYYLIMSPLTYLLHIDSSIINEAAETLKELGKTATRAQELNIIEAVKSGAISSPVIAEKLGNINFDFFGIDLTQKPTFSLNIFGDFQTLWIMPIIAFLAQIVSSFISMRIQKHINPDAPNMGGLLLTMPILSLFIGFSLPGGVTFYWACSSLIGGLIQSGVQLFYGPHKMLAKERAKELSKQCDFEKKQIEKFSAVKTAINKEEGSL